MQTRRTRSTYIPKKHSLAAKVIEYLQANDDEELSRSDIAKKFSVQPTIVDGELAEAVRSRWLSKARSDDGVVYRLVAIRNGTPLPFVANAEVTGAKRRVRRQAVAQFDPRTIEIEVNAPRTLIPKKSDLWDEVLRKLDSVDKSFVVPKMIKYSVAHAMQYFRRRVDTSVRFSIEKAGHEEIRVRRVQ